MLKSSRNDVLVYVVNKGAYFQSKEGDQMNKAVEFYNRIMQDETLKAKLRGIIGDESPDKFSDEVLCKLKEMAKTLGLELTSGEIKDYLSRNELSDEELTDVAGGVHHRHRPSLEYRARERLGLRGN